MRDPIGTVAFMNNQYKALIIGATGATGRSLVRQLVESDHFSEIAVIVRRELEEWLTISKDKLKVYVVTSMDELASGDWSVLDGYDACFNTLGTHIIAPKQQMKTVNLDYAVLSGKLARESGIRYYGYLSGMGANPNHFIYLAKVKGMAESKLAEMGFEHVTTFRIRSIRDRNNENDVRLMDRILALIPFKALSLETRDLATVLEYDSLFHLNKDNPDYGVSVLSGGDMASILKRTAGLRLQT
ncbi:MAG: hypothetical protein Aurels2KO_53240 [Aureliella sp.]